MLRYPLSVTLFLFAAVGMPAAAINRAAVKVIGPVEYGQPTGSVHYSGHPKFHAFEFNAKPGDRIEATVASKRGSMRAYLTGSDFKTLAGGTGHFSATIAPGSKPASYFILIQEASGRPADYTLDLERPSTAAIAYLACQADSDCAAVDRAGCCHNGWKDAVNKEAVAAYREANPCGNPRPICPMYIVKDDRLPMCNRTTGQCEMAKRPEPKP